MKVLKKILLVFFAILVLSLIGGFFYFKTKFTPPPNYLKVVGISKEVPFRWVPNGDNLHAALLLPVKVKGIESQLYMQLDFGSPITVFYARSLKSIQPKLLSMDSLQKKSNQVVLNFNLEEMQISSREFRLLDYGDSVDVENPSAVNIIGTIGTDLLEKRVVMLDFKNNNCSFLDSLPGAKLTDFDFEMRKILFPAKIGNEELKLLFDSGTSGFELITSKNEWEKYRTSGEIKVEKGNSWGNILTVFTAPANTEIQFGNSTLKLSEVTYIEGTSKIQNLLMRFSGMQGMIGNKIFLNHKMIIDCKNKKFRVD